MGDNNFPHRGQRRSVSRRSALAAIGIGASATIAGCSANEGSDNRPEEPDAAPSDQQEGTTHETGRREGYALAEVLPGEKFGSVTIDKFAHTLQFSGTREPAWMVRPFNEDIRPESSSYEDVGSGVEYGVIPFPPGKVPLLRLNGRIDAPEGVETGLQISIANRPAAALPTGGFEHLEDGPVRQPIMDVAAVGSSKVFDEVYLTDVEDVVMGMDNGHKLPSHTFLFEAKTDSPGEATISSASTIALDMEAL